MASDAGPSFFREVEVLKHIDNPKRLLVMAKARWLARVLDGLIQSAFARMSEGSVPDIVPEGDRLDKILVQPDRAADRSADLGDLKGVGEARAVVVTFGVDEDLRLVPQ